MRIDFTWPDRLIPMVTTLGPEEHMVDLFINSILLENDEDTSRRITRMVLDLMYKDQPLWRMEIPLPALVSHLAVDTELDKLPVERRRNMVGEFLSERLSRIIEDVTFKPGDRGLLRRFPIRFLASAAPDTLIARVFSGSHLLGRSSIPVTPFCSRKALSFPVQGVWQAINNFDYTLGHRAYAGQEFAIDLVQTGPSGLMRKGQSDGPEDYYCFGADVLAMADGQVVEVENRITDNPADCQLSKKEIEKSIKKFGYLAGRSGNYVIIKHDDDRFSFYAHLQHESSDLKPGQKVTKNQFIGRVGNSGQSSKSHLHLQLNEGSSPLGHRGLPMTFENLIDFSGKKLPLVTQNNIIVHTTA